MSQRKLMGALSIILLAFLFILVGCGDGKRNSKAHPNKKLAQGKVGAAGGGNGPQKGSDKDLSLKVANLKNISEALQSQLNGESVDAHSLSSGAYTLESVFGHVKFMRVSGDEVAAMVGAQVINGNLTGQTSNKVGLIASDTDEGRTLSVPMSFRVKNGALDLSTIASTNYHSQLELAGGLQQELGGNTAGFNVMNSLNGAPNSSGSYPVTIDGREAGIQIRKTSTGVRLVVTITEKKAGATSKEGDSTLIRTLVFSYSLKADAAAAPQAPAAPANNNNDTATTTPEGPAADQGLTDFNLVQPAVSK